jgi:hypothetical protein
MTAVTGRVIPKWPNFFDADRGEDIPTELIGATIAAIGTTRERVEGGGLVIDYKPCGSAKVKRLVLAFNEVGMWALPFQPNLAGD